MDIEMMKMNLSNKLETFTADLEKDLAQAMVDAGKAISKVEDETTKALLIEALERAKAGDLNAVKNILNGLRK